MGDLVQHEKQSLAEDRLRKLQTTYMPERQYEEMMESRTRRIQQRTYYPTGVDKSAFIGYAEHVYVLGGQGGERRLHLQLDGLLSQKCTQVACFPGKGLNSDRKFWVVPLVDDAWWIRRLPKDLLQTDAILAEVHQNVGMSLEVIIERQVSLVTFENGKSIAGPESP